MANTNVVESIIFYNFCELNCVTKIKLLRRIQPASEKFDRSNIISAKTVFSTAGIELPRNSNGSGISRSRSLACFELIPLVDQLRGRRRLRGSPYTSPHKRIDPIEANATLYRERWPQKKQAAEKERRGEVLRFSYLHFLRIHSRQ